MTHGRLTGDRQETHGEPGASTITPCEIYGRPMRVLWAGFLMDVPSTLHDEWTGSLLYRDRNRRWAKGKRSAVSSGTPVMPRGVYILYSDLASSDMSRTTLERPLDWILLHVYAPIGASNACRLPTFC